MLSYRSNCLGFVCLILLSLHVNVRGDEETGVQKAKAPKATALKAAIMDFKAVVENSPNAVAADSLGETQSQKLKAAIDQSAKEDRCRSLAYYTLGMHYFSKNAFDAASTNFAAAGNSIETTPGSKLMALQMQFLCLKNLGRTNETIELAGQIARAPGPQELRDAIGPAAEMIKQQLLTESNLSNNVARADNYAWMSETEKSATGGMAGYFGAICLQRIQKLASMGETNAALVLCQAFLSRHMLDPYAAAIALNEARLKKSRLLLTSVELDKIIQLYSVDNAPSQDVIFELASAQIAEGKFEASLETLDRVLKYQRKKEDLQPVSPALVEAAMGEKMQVYRILGRENDATRMAKELVNKHPKAPESFGAKEHLNSKERLGIRARGGVLLMLLVLVLGPVVYWAIQVGYGRRLQRTK